MKKIGFVIAFFVLLVSACSLPSLTYGQSSFFSSGDVVVLSENETIDHDYFASGGNVDVRGTVNGDAYVAGGDIIMDGIIEGDLLVAGGSITINGTVKNNVRVVGGNVRIRGTVGKNITAVAGNVFIEDGAQVQGDVVSAAGNIQIGAPVQNVTIAGGELTVDSVIRRDMTAAVGELRLTNNASVSGNIDYWSEEKARIATQASVSGQTTYHPTILEQERTAEAAETFFSGVGVFLQIVSFMTLLFVGLLLIWLVPNFMTQTATVAVKQFWMSLLVGFLFFIVTPMIIIVLLITLLGIPLALLLLVGYLLILFLVKIVVAVLVGETILSWVGQKTNIYVTFILGLLLLFLLDLIPFVGGLVSLVLVLVGIGALLIQKRLTYLSLRNKKLL